MPLRIVLRRATALVALTAVLVGCPSPPADSSTTARSGAAAQSAPALPIADSVALRLAAEAAAQFDSVATVSSGPRSCDPATPAQESDRCVLALTVRRDVGQFSPNNVPGRYAVLAAVRNGGDLPETRTGIAAGVTAYFLVEQGSEGRGRAWYFSVDHGNAGQVLAIREAAYAVCEHQHSEQAKPLSAWRHCADAPQTGAIGAAVTTSANDRPIWVPCGTACCVDR